MICLREHWLKTHSFYRYSNPGTLENKILPSETKAEIFEKWHLQERALIIF